MDRLDADTIECVRQLANLVALQQNTRILPETFRTALADRQYSIMRDAGLETVPHDSFENDTPHESHLPNLWTSRCAACSTGSTEDAEDNTKKQQM